MSRKNKQPVPETEPVEEVIEPEQEELSDFNKALNSSDTRVSNTAKGLLDYNVALKTEFNAQSYSMHYTLYNNIRIILFEKDPVIRAKLLNTVCSAFVEFKKESFSNIKLFRFDTEWKYSLDDLEAVNILMVIFTKLSDMKTRSLNLQSINFANVHKLKAISEVHANNLELYFKPQ